jgi:hypothetical protein
MGGVGELVARVVRRAATAAIPTSRVPSGDRTLISRSTPDGGPGEAAATVISSLNTGVAGGTSTTGSGRREGIEELVVGALGVVVGVGSRVPELEGELVAGGAVAVAVMVAVRVATGPPGSTPSGSTNGGITSARVRRARTMPPIPAASTPLPGRPSLPPGVTGAASHRAAPATTRSYALRRRPDAGAATGPVQSL